MQDFIQTNKLELIGKLTASLVHEIRNPLSAIKLNLDYMNMAKDDLPNDIKEIVSESLDAFEQVNFLIEDVLDFTRKPSSKETPIDIIQVTERCLKIISITARMKGVSIEKDFSNGLPQIEANKNKMMQVFLNLLNNAIEASEEKGKIVIRAYVSVENGSEFVFWEVQDFGCGIKEENKKKILDGFFTTKQKGHGIGLGVCKSLAEEIHSELIFESTFGVGTTFSIKFRLE